MQNGYALCTPAGLDAIAGHLGKLDPDGIDDFRGKLCIRITVTLRSPTPLAKIASLVSQAFCSALPAAYTRIPRGQWQAFASLVLQAAYEATMWAAVHNAQRGASNVVL